MAEVKTDSDEKLMAQVQAIRQLEYELINDLLVVLPKIDNLGEDRISQVRDALFHADHPFLMVFIGPFSSGKSSIINTLLGNKNLLAIGPTPTTDRINILRWGDESQRMDSGGDVDTVFYPSPMLKKVSFVDTPGLESVFKRHEETTRKFLHRSDVVLLVMLATQAMTAGNLAYLQQLKQYGKKIIIVVNQSDLLSPEERVKVREYILEQSKDKLGFRPDVWMVSAKLGAEAYQGENGEFDDVTWAASGMNQIEEYVDKQLSDAELMRQKFQTPLQIVQNAHHAALSSVRENQSALDNYQSITENIDQQIAAQRRQQEKNVREINSEVEAQFTETARRGSDAIREIFQLSRALGLMWRGLTFSLMSLFRRADRISYVKKAFDQHKVFEPIEELQNVRAKLGPRLEGQDMHDIDDLVKYGNREINALPEDMSDKVIGSIQAPIKYERKMVEEMHPSLEDIEDKARVVETQDMEETVRSTLFYLLLWETLVIALLVALGSLWGSVGAEGASNLPVLILVLLIAAGMIGFLMLPLRGRFLATTYTNGLMKLQNQYIEKLSEAADKQVEYGIQLRRDTIAPLTRLIEAQTQIQNDQMTRLQSVEQKIVSVESQLASLGKKKLFGLRG